MCVSEHSTDLKCVSKITIIFHTKIPISNPQRHNNRQLQTVIFYFPGKDKVWSNILNTHSYSTVSSSSLTLTRGVCAGVLFTEDLVLKGRSWRTFLFFFPVIQIIIFAIDKHSSYHCSSITGYSHFREFIHTYMAITKYTTHNYVYRWGISYYLMFWRAQRMHW